MALPTGPIPRVAFDEIIEESWGDSVAQSLNNLGERRDEIVWVPDSEILAPDVTAPDLPAELPNWFRVGGATGEIVVPDWATNVYAHIEMNGIRDPGDGAVYALQVKIGPQVGRRVRMSGRNGWFGAAWTSYLPASSLEGDRGVWIAAGRLTGDGITTRWRVDGDSDIAVVFEFMGAIRFYPGL